MAFTRWDPRIRRAWRRRTAAIAIATLLIAAPAGERSNFRSDGPAGRRFGEPSFRRAQLLHPAFIVWNVGQGLWTTLSLPDTCWHFDMGGERADWASIERECAGKANRASFSHWDLDHISFAAEAARRLSGFCVALRPAGPDPGGHKKRLLDPLPDCDPADKARGNAANDNIDGDSAGGRHPRLLQLTRPSDNVVRPTARALALASGAERGTRPRGPTSNEASHVFEIQGVALVTGDSPKGNERIWSRRLARGDASPVLVLGHHGSRTSTSETLLQRLPRLVMAVASARKNRYGHPHPEVARLLRSRGIALLSTEVWGHLRFLLPQPPLPAFRPPPNVQTGRRPSPG
jgi:competence protein ComEC